MNNPENDPLDVFREFGLRIIPSADFKDTLAGLACWLARSDSQPFTPQAVQVCQGVGRKAIRNHLGHLETLNAIERLHPPRTGKTPLFTFSNTDFAITLRDVLRENPPLNCQEGDRTRETPPVSAQELLLAQLAKERIRQGLTQTALGALLGVQQNTVSQMEKSGDPKLSTLIKYVEALGGTIHITFPDEEDK